jgi:ubiquinone/menaquinone biosynthesis C-methylase UbiE
MQSEQGNFIPDLGPDVYTEWRASDVGTITERLERRLVLELLGDVGNRGLLDIGCGDGKLAVELARRGANVTAVDASAPMLAAARTRASEEGMEIRFSRATADHLPFPDESFDVVTAVTVLCFVSDAGPVFREIARVLRPGGKLVMGELGKWSSWAAQRRIRAWLGSAMWRRGRFRTAGELRSLAEGAGLSPQEPRGAVFYPRWSWAARRMARWDDRFGRRTTVGAAFIAFSAEKPEK